MKNKETRSTLPAWQIRKKKASMPRPKSTGYLKDFNILSAEDDVGDVSITGGKKMQVFTEELYLFITNLLKQIFIKGTLKLRFILKKIV